MTGDYSTLAKEPDGVTWKLSAPGCAPLRLANGLTAYNVKAMVEHAYQAGRAVSKPLQAEQRLERFVNTLVDRLDQYVGGCEDGAHTPCNVLLAVAQAVKDARQEADI